MKTTDLQIQTIKGIANDFGAKFRTYSGRGMYGAYCLGITTDQPEEVINMALELGIKGAARDNMGLSTVVYWPRLEVPADFRV